MLRGFLPTPFFSDEDSGGSGAGGQGTTQAQSSTTPPSNQGASGDGGGTPAWVQAFTNQLNARYQGDALRFSERLYEENHGLREERRKLKEKVTELAQRAPEDAVILTGDEAQAYRTYKALGDVEEVKTRLEQATSAITERDTMKRQILLHKVAQAAGYAESVLTTLDTGAGKLTYELRAEGEGTEQHEVPYVKDGDNWVRLSEYATTKWKDFLPSLERTPPEDKGVPWAQQQTRGKPPSTSAAETYLKNQYRGIPGISRHDK